jgi:desulfoferrodoxin (superoxide reductase-like protein)
MKKFVASIICLLLFTSNAIAHPPSKIEVEYHKAKNEIVVAVFHSVGTDRHQKERTHFIKEIDLLIDGEIVDSKAFNYQNNPLIVRARFSVPENEDNKKMEIKAICSTGSESTKEISIDKLPAYK